MKDIPEVEISAKAGSYEALWLYGDSARGLCDGRTGPERQETTGVGEAWGHSKGLGLVGSPGANLKLESDGARGGVEQSRLGSEGQLRFLRYFSSAETRLLLFGDFGNGLAGRMA